MDTVLYIFSGILFKLYDDINDNKTDISTLSLEFLKGLLVYFSTIGFLKSADFTLFFCVIAVICYFVNQLDTDFWKVWGTLPFLSIIIHIPYFSELSILNIVTRIFFSIFFIAVIFGEAKLIPEEMSIRKYIIRISFLIAELSGVYLANTYGFEYVAPLFLFFSGYFISNLIFHAPTVWSLLKEEPTLEKKPKIEETKT